MKPTSPRTDSETNRNDATRKKEADRSSAGVTGGAPAAEEDIGTEGAGTEPRESTKVERETGSSSGKSPSDKDPAA